jgi:hypothetical protein
MVRRPPSVLLLAVSLLVTSLLAAGCGGKNTPAVCTDADALKTSISDLTDIKLDQTTLSQLQDKLTAVQTDASKLKSSAEAQFGDQVSAVEAAVTSVKTTVSAAVSTPNATTVAAVGSALQALKTALSDLQTALQSTC